VDKVIVPSKVEGEINAPPSKSMTQRAIAAALLTDGTTIILNPSGCDDSLDAINIAAVLGSEILSDGKNLKIRGSGKLRGKMLNCGESGLAIRMFSPIAALNDEEITLTGKGSLTKRPMSMVEEALRQLGVKCSSRNGFLPLTVRGPLKAGKCEIDGSVSSQLLTGLLMALPVLEGDSEIYVKDLKSKPYIDMTLQVLDKFGITVQNDNYSLFIIKGSQKYTPSEFTVEGDWSGGALLLAAGAVNGELTVHGLHPDSRQSDKAMLTVLDLAGAQTSIKENSVRVSKSDMRSFDFDATESPDLFPPLAALAAYCKGTSSIRGVSRLVHKESNRANALKEEFRKMNIKVDMEEDTMLITGGEVSGAHIDSHNDHRIAMAAAVAALRASDRVIITDAQCVTKSYPSFFDDLKQIGARIYE
jgi:3-phosphoshikimate 1-carboxyvinyltransferase